jgi:Flp pilus assembly protein TadD
LSESTNQERAARRLWILGPKRDLLLFVLTPAAILPALAFTQRLAPETLATYVLGIGGFGHHLPGFIRAYSDPGLFRRFRLRFTLVPALLAAIGILFAFLNLNALVFATVAWGIYHGAMQVNGFLRIYDSKAGSFDRATAGLDRLMCLLWFGLAVLHSPDKLIALITPFYTAGGPLLGPDALAGMRHAWDIGTACVTALFLANTWRRSRAGVPPNPIKLLAMGAAFAYWGYCMMFAPTLLLGVLLWEIFHDVQYNVLVWLFQRRRVDANLGTGRFEGFLFAPGTGRLLLYAALILGYGAVGVATSYSDLDLPEKIMGQGVLPWLLRLTVISALLHFYYDGFIWRMREPETRRGLTLEGQGGAGSVAALARGAPLVRGWRHGLKWAFFFVPVAFLGWRQYRGLGPGQEAQIQNLPETVPQSWAAHFLAGTYYKGQGRRDEAETHYRQVVAYNPGLAEGHTYLADLLYKKGDDEGALGEYRRAGELDSSNALVRMNLGFLYLRRDQPVLAEPQFRAALAHEPEDADMQFGLGSALLRQHRFEEAKPYFETVLRLEPGHSDAINSLGMIRELSGDPAGAAEYYRHALAADSGNASARANLAAVLPKLGPSH